MGINGFSIVHAACYVGQEVVLRGWVRHIRSSGSLFFIEMRDGTGILQVVVTKDDVSQETFRIAPKSVSSPPWRFAAR